MIRFEIDTKRFVSDPLEGETIIMDMVAGRLFLLEEGAATVWENIVKGGARDELLSSVGSRYGSEAVTACETFLQRLSELGLVSEISTNKEIAVAANSGLWPAAIGEFRLTEYDDMIDIITMDPIHDVDPNRGWPFNRES
jgi:hypothetical protein